MLAPQHFVGYDPEGYSIWFCDYKYTDENTVNYVVMNKVQTHHSALCLRHPVHVLLYAAVHAVLWMDGTFPGFADGILLAVGSRTMGNDAEH